MNKIRIGIVGYGNIGRGVELAIERNDDMELVAVVTRRNPEDVNILTEGVKKVHLDDVLSLKGSGCDDSVRGLCDRSPSYGSTDCKEL